MTENYYRAYIAIGWYFWVLLFLWARNLLTNGPRKATFAKRITVFIFWWARIAAARKLRNIEIFVATISGIGIVITGILLISKHVFLKYLSVIFLLWTIGFLRFFLFPHFESAPQDQDFFVQNSAYLIGESVSSSEKVFSYTIEDQEKKYKKFPFKDTVKLRNRNHFTFVSKQTKPDDAVIVQSPEWTFLVIFPQSKLSLSSTMTLWWQEYEIKIQDWKVALVVFDNNPQKNMWTWTTDTQIFKQETKEHFDNSWTQIMSTWSDQEIQTTWSKLWIEQFWTGIIIINSPKELQILAPNIQEKILSLQEDFEQKKADFFIKKAWWTWLEYPFAQNFVSQYLKLLNFISPRYFPNNQENFISYQKYFKIPEYLSETTETNAEKISTSMRNKGSFGFSKTKINSRIQKFSK
jgi:hypothetical protein